MDISNHFPFISKFFNINTILKNFDSKISYMFYAYVPCLKFRYSEVISMLAHERTASRIKLYKGTVH